MQMDDQAWSENSNQRGQPWAPQTASEKAAPREPAGGKVSSQRHPGFVGTPDGSGTMEAEP